MSWAEIKKAVNSDLDIPLNEYLNGVPIKIHHEHNVQNILFEATGKLLIFGVALSTGKQASVHKIMIDDEIIVNRVSTSNQTMNTFIATEWSNFALDSSSKTGIFVPGPSTDIIVHNLLGTFNSPAISSPPIEANESQATKMAFYSKPIMCKKITIQQTLVSSDGRLTILYAMIP